MIMKKTHILILLTLTTTCSFAETNLTPSKYKCAGIEKSIDKVNAKMRAGYKVKEGERLKQQLRNLKAQRNECKKKGFSVD